MKKLVRVGSAVAALLVLTSCGNDIPTDATTAEYCSLFPLLGEALDEWDTNGDRDKVDEVVDQAEQDGVPEDMSDDDRETFERFVQALAENDSYDDYSSAVEPLESDLRALEEYNDQTC